MNRDTDFGTALLRHARSAIAGELGLAAAGPVQDAALASPGATFVTLRIDDALRGCIGSLRAWRSLVADVRANAIAAAFGDPRFPPLARAEFAAVAIEVSVLGPSEPVAGADEDAAVAQLTPGVDGVIFSCGARRATFLPQVWEQLPDPRDFLAALKRKAGLPADFWSPDVELARYRVEKFAERAAAATEVR